MTSRYLTMHTSTKNASFIPIIDISNANAQTGDDLVNAVTEWGFVYIRGIGVGFTKETIDRMFQLVRSRVWSECGTFFCFF